jgi:hypothetical protein
VHTAVDPYHCFRVKDENDSTVIQVTDAMNGDYLSMMKHITFAFALFVAIVPCAAAEEGAFYGLLRGRDLTPFGFLRLDMRPAHAIAIERGSFVIETELGYQNTWALSPEVEKWLTAREAAGRRELGSEDLQEIRDLPGENYLVDYESAVLDVTVHYKFSDSMSAYLIANAVSYEGGFLDSTIEGFHDEFGFSSFGRPAASRDDVNLIYDLKSSQVAFFDSPTNGGLSDPTLGIRYTGVALSERWHAGFEGAVKIPVAGRRLLLSTGRTDWGVQASLQRRGNRHAVYANAAAVYYAGASEPAPQESQVIPTVIVGYEYRWSERTNINLQGYLSKSTYSSETTDLEELSGEKYQVTLGFRHMRNDFLFTFAVTENLQNINNTPDIGFLVGVAFIPRLIQ